MSRWVAGLCAALGLLFLFISRWGPRQRRPVKLRAEKAYFSADHLAWLRERK
ncbi:hypothetical protein ACRWOO_09535 [Streptomyces sp. NEAU-PBA10]|uniref:hypothetical protein n=1 Tax=Streptomyces sp. NEAU-PBA10 TaxID=3438640 RepID=UPI0036E1842E